VTGQAASSRSSISYAQILAQLNEALAFCTNLGIEAEAGRFGQYRKDVQRAIDISTAGLASFSPAELERIREEARRLRIALSESLEFGKLLPYLQSCKAEDIVPKLRKVVDGPPLPSDENESSNIARNIQFELTFASMVARAGFAPKLGEHPDLRVVIDGRDLLFECKRIFSPSKVEARLEQAGKQLKRDAKNFPMTARGIGVVSLSRLLNPDAGAFRIADRETGKAALGAWVARMVKDLTSCFQELFRRDVVVAVFSYVESDLENAETGTFDHGGFFHAESYEPPFAPYKAALRHTPSESRSARILMRLLHDPSIARG
jgi:hypothetical protein